MGVAHRGVGHEEPLLVADPGSELHRPEFLEPLAGARRGGGEWVVIWEDCQLAAEGRWPPLDQRIPIDDHVAEVLKQPRGPVAADREVEQGRRLVDEAGRAVACEEFGVGDEVHEKRDVGLHAPNAKFLQAPLDVAGGFLEVEPAGRDLHQERIEVGRDDGAGEGGAGIEPDSHAAG